MSEKVKVMVQDVLQAYVFHMLPKLEVALKDVEVRWMISKKIYKACIRQNEKDDSEIVLGCNRYSLVAGFIGNGFGDYVTKSLRIIYLIRQNDWVKQSI